MALRIIDNALPVAQERPRKLQKLPKQPEMGVNDENNPVAQPPQPSADLSVDYVASEDLEPLSDPESASKSLLEELASKDWTKVCEALNNTRRMALHHSSLLLPILGKVIVGMVKTMKSPRSALCKTSIMASADFFNAFGETLLEEPHSNPIHDLILQLLMKASQDKKFVCEEADRALNAMVNSVAPVPLLRQLQCYVGHSNLRIRAKAAVSISNCLSKMGLVEMEGFGSVSMAKMAADLLNDKLPDAREAARSIVNSVYQKITAEEENKQEAWQKFCETNLTQLNAQAMMKIVSSR
ncbi:PREDICTED: crescerin-1-like [Tarenaya hassleriana]|uniref:crescerin-1-like n=1 Tax=Tarenaya hassleriana TaxID=28532 RepID=UPI00053C2133|nr:PREDICTED: crescerin-1-like [Tarenaya hassleriana]